MGEFSLALSLGHNSSAVLIRKGKILGGYEEERFSQVKADSRFPRRSIEELISRFHLPDDTDCYVGHWFLDGSLPMESNKYWNREFLREQFPNGGIFGLRDDFTHHDSHALSACVFAGPDFPRPFHLFVVDGFGTEGECYSVYESIGDTGEIRLVDRLFGFDNSVGLIYQYVVHHLGMKMHQDEYKMLAYEPYILEVTQYLQKIRNVIIATELNLGFDRHETNLGTLEYTKERVKFYLDWLFRTVRPESERQKRILAAYYVQGLVEQTLKVFYDTYRPKNLLVAGGVFYNVKLNSMLADLVPGKFCAMPLAGDQGAGLGVYQEYNKDLKWPNHLFWGRRTLDTYLDEPGVVQVFSDESAMAEVREILNRQGMVNLVHGSMEFGPRALCNTSTLALPGLLIAEDINHMNDRTNEMPFGLVVTEDQAKSLFVDTDKIHRSLEYMIVTRDFVEPPLGTMLGGAHYYPINGRFTCRPQVVGNMSRMGELLTEFGPLINTSFNYHGVPIVNGVDEMLYTHRKQRERNPEIRTVVIGG